MENNSSEAGQAKYLNALHEMAEVPSLEVTKPIKIYARSANTVYQQAQIYQVENDLEKAFILYLKYSKYTLVWYADSLTELSYSIYVV